MTGLYMTFMCIAGSCLMMGWTGLAGYTIVVAVAMEFFYK